MRWTIAICALLGLAALQDTGPRIRREGELLLLDASGVDLDDGRVGGYIVLDGANDPEATKLSFKGSDFWFRAGKRRFFRPQHGAMFSQTIFTTIDHANCASATYTKGEIRVDELRKGEQICLHTSTGRYASIEIKHYQPKTAWLFINFVTWEK